jgi:hypothetical protein
MGKKNGEREEGRWKYYSRFQIPDSRFQNCASS